MTKSTVSLFIVILFFSLEAYCQTSVSPEVKQTVVKNGIGLGSVIAVVISWERNKSVFYAIVHGILGWLYVIYFLVTRK